MNLCQVQVTTGILYYFDLFGQPHITGSVVWPWFWSMSHCKELVPYEEEKRWNPIMVLTPDQNSLEPSINTTTRHLWPKNIRRHDSWSTRPFFLISEYFCKIPFVVKQILSIPTSCGRQETIFSIFHLFINIYILFYPFRFSFYLFGDSFISLYPFPVSLKFPNLHLWKLCPKRTNYCSGDSTIGDSGS